jgi:thiol-disulfide isomerase/thioredoxin
MKTITILISVLFFLNSCKEQKISNEIIIEGQVKNMPDGKIYLTEAHYWKIPLDSTICTNGHFIFKINTDSSFVPYMAAIHFPDSSKQTKVGGLFFRNYMLGADSMKYSGEGFYLENGYTKIEGDNQSKSHLRVFAGKETDIMFKNQFTDFGWLGNIDSTTRLQRIAFFKKEIKKYPFSYFLLQSIYDAKEQYSEKEINEILALFDSNVQKSKLGDKFKTYLSNRTDPNEPYPNLSLIDSNNQRHHIIDPNFKVSMLVFWASWCGPCRMEIPLLKEIQNEYKGKGLNLVSISIDDDKYDWKKALNQEKMSWTQYIVDKDKIDLVEAQFNFSAIPLVVFTDKTGKELKRFPDYNKDRKKQYETVINQYLK